MSEVRLIVQDHQWERMEPHLPGKARDPGRTGKDNRLFVEAVLWLA
ncbi:MAG: transposase, partial [Magnetospirillum sp.]